MEDRATEPESRWAAASVGRSKAVRAAQLTRALGRAGILAEHTCHETLGKLLTVLLRNRQYRSPERPSTRYCPTGLLDSMALIVSSAWAVKGSADAGMSRLRVLPVLD